MKKTIIAFITIITLAGCSTPVKRVSTTAASKITVAVALPNHLELGTIGTTIFNNKSMKGDVSGTPLPTRIRNIANNAISSSNKIRLVKSNGTLDQPTAVKRNMWSGKPEIQNKKGLVQKARALGANYILLITGKDTQDPFYGTNIYIDNIGVIQRSILGLKRSNAYAAMNMHVLDTSTSQEVSTTGFVATSSRAGKPWITPQTIPNAAQIEEIISQIPIKNEMNKGLVEMGLK